MLADATRTTRVGGEHVTDFLALLLHAQKVENYGTLLPRRCKEVAREVKEKHAFVAVDFVEAQQQFGYFEFESVQVMKQELLDASFKQGLLKYDPNGGVSAEGRRHAVTSGSSGDIHANKTENAAQIRRSVEIRLPDGVMISFDLDVERFHSSEVLFTPSMFEECNTEEGVVTAMLTTAGLVDECVRDEVCARVVLTGGSRAVPGITERVAKDFCEAYALGFSTAITPTVVVADAGVGGGAVGSSAVALGASNRLRAALDENLNDQIPVSSFVTSFQYEEKGSSQVLEDVMN